MTIYLCDLWRHLDFDKLSPETNQRLNLSICRYGSYAKIDLTEKTESGLQTALNRLERRGSVAPPSEVRYVSRIRRSDGTSRETSSDSARDRS